MTQFVLVPHPYYPEHMQLNPWALCQAHWTWQSDTSLYRDAFEAYGKAGGKIILDWQHPTRATEDDTITAGVPKLSETDLDRYFGLIGRLKPTIVVIPDALNDRTHTLGMARLFFRQWERYGRKIANHEPEFMFVPQGVNDVEYLSCLTDAMKDDPFAAEIDVIGIPKWLEQRLHPVVSGPRRAFIVPQIWTRIAEYQDAENYSLHMLGVWRGLNEMRRINGVRTWDTSLPIGAAQTGLDYTLHTRDADLLNEKFELRVGPAHLDFQPFAKHTLHPSAWSIVAHNVRMAQTALQLTAAEELQ